MESLCRFLFIIDKNKEITLTKEIFLFYNETCILLKELSLHAIGIMV